jgi:hypothetical protein
MFRNKIPETLQPGRLCNGMKAPIMTTNFSWAALRNPGFRKLSIVAVISGTYVGHAR